MIKTLNMILFLAGPIGVVLLAWKGGAKVKTMLLGFVIGIGTPALLLLIPAAIYMQISHVSRDEALFYISPNYFGVLHFAVLCSVVYGWYIWPDD